VFSQTPHVGRVLRFLCEVQISLGPVIAFFFEPSAFCRDTMPPLEQSRRPFLPPFRLVFEDVVPLFSPNRRIILVLPSCGSVRICDEFFTLLVPLVLPVLCLHRMFMSSPAPHQRLQVHPLDCSFEQFYSSLGRLFPLLFLIPAWGPFSPFFQAVWAFFYVFSPCRSHYPPPLLPLPIKIIVLPPQNRLTKHHYLPPPRIPQYP